ncbi:MAG: lysophospholipid acyltransferase family protein [Bryobacteraceae bacterium]|jgi:1-acyl-sn-glycerol-3-phosphate acyltransferase
MLSAIRAFLILDPLILLATALMGTVSMVVSIFDSSGRTQHRVARAWARILLGIAGARIRVEGGERIASGSSYVIVANHLSFMDIPVILAHIPVEIRFLAKRSLFKSPFIGPHLRRAGHLPVEREDVRASLKSMAEAAQIIRNRGISVLIFPEGGRSPDGMREFREGAAYIAIKAGVSAVPVALDGTRQILPMGSIHMKPGEVVLRIGDPIPVDGLKIHDRHALTEELQRRVAELAGGAYRD